MKVVGFGDFLIHFSPFDTDRFLQADLMRVSFTGAEANVCAALALWGEDVHFVTKIPEHLLARKGTMFLNGLGVKTDSIEHSQERMGVYFLEKGYSLRSSSVIYDRQYTAFANSNYEDYDWETIFKDTDVLYVTGITPSLSESLLNCCEKMVKEARNRNIQVFFDVNLRPTLCDITQSRTIFNTLSPYITHLIGNEEHLKQLLKIEVENPEDENRLYDFTKTVENRTNIKNIAITVRRTPSANKAIIYASYYNGEEFAISTKQTIDVVDRVGSGDAFSAGVVYSYLHHASATDTVNFATLSSALKHTVNNDINYLTIEEMKNYLEKQSFDVNR